MFALKFAIFASITLVKGGYIDIEPFISNGNEAEIAEFPFLVSIQHVDVHVCAGSLLNEKWILSAARCFVRPINELIIEFGNSVIAPGPTGPNKSKVSRTVLHENYVQNPVIHNIGLAESQDAIVTGFFEPFVKLMVSGARFMSGTHSAHAGWGHIAHNVRNNQLQKAAVNIVSNAECDEASGLTQGPERQNICTMAESVICNGDLGSPLLVNGVLVGLASFRNGDPCLNIEGKFPNVYTDVSYYIDWIQNQTGIDYQLNFFLQRRA